MESKPLNPDSRLTFPASVAHCAQMKSISIRELHMNTGKWVRAAGASGEPVIVLDRGRPVARLSPLQEAEGTLFSARSKVAGFEDLPELSTDSAEILEEDRR